jgi:hypothetical protein
MRVRIARIAVSRRRLAFRARAIAAECNTTFTNTASTPGLDVTIVANRPQCDIDHDTPR